jgi:ribosomal protein S18 acetylase RimI-like enzyme
VSDSFSLRPLPEARDAEATRVLAAAFSEDPNLRWCFLAHAPGYEERLAGYLETGHAWHLAAGFPVQAAISTGDDRIAGVAYAMDPDAGFGAEGAPPLAARLVARCGAEAAERFGRYNRAVEAVSPQGPHHVLALVGVVPAWRGRGVGRALVRWLTARCDADPRSGGVLLDTSSERNVRFYRQLGFEVVAEVRLDGLHERVMVRPRA